MLTQEERTAIVDYRIEKAYNSLNEAKQVSKLGFWNLTGNRLYYSAFHIASALLLKENHLAHTHKGVIHLIGSKYVLTGRIEKKYGRLFSRLFELRQSGDYDDMYDSTQEEIMPLIEQTEEFIIELERQIKKDS